MPGVCWASGERNTYHLRHRHVRRRRDAACVDREHSRKYLNIYAYFLFFGGQIMWAASCRHSVPLAALSVLLMVD